MFIMINIMKSCPKNTAMHSANTTRIISRNTNQQNKPIASPATAATLCHRGKTGQKQCEFPPKALSSVHMGSKVGGKIHQVIHQEDVWPEMVELRNRRGRMRVWKDWKRWRGLYKSRWKEIKEKGSLSGLAWRREELVWCSITGQLIVCPEWTLWVCTHVWMCLCLREGGSLKPTPVMFCHVCSVRACLYSCVYMWVCMWDLKVTHECSPQSAGSWLSCLSSSRWFWVWAPRWPGTQMTQLHPRCPSGPLGISRNLASLREPEQRGQRETESGKKKKEGGKEVRGKGREARDKESRREGERWK